MSGFVGDVSGEHGLNCVGCLEFRTDGASLNVHVIDDIGIFSRSLDGGSCQDWYLFDAFVAVVQVAEGSFV